MIDKTRLHLILKEYKKDFPKLFWTSKTQNEKYKWIAVKHFQDNWDIDAPDFLEMFTRATAKTENLLAAMNYFPRGMIMAFCKVAPEEVRNMFRDLFDESKSVVTRVETFIKESERLRVKYKPEDDWKAHYQNTNSVTTYLWLRYPDKYYIYKYSECKAVASELDNSYKPTKGAKPETLLGSIKLYDEIAEYLATDSELVSMLRDSLDDTCYPDTTLRTLAIDVGFYISRYYRDKDNKKDLSGWWPSLDEYNPNLTKDDWKKYILEIEKPGHPCPMTMLKAMMEIGGEASCKKLVKEFGGTTSGYIGCAVNLGKRVKKYFNLPPCMDGDKERYFPFPFFGKEFYDEEGHQYVYKIRPELFEALKEIDLSDVSPYYDEEDDEDMKSNITKNTILYGPPGTGKTYNTVCYAVAIVENKNLEEIMAKASEEGGYYEVFSRYNEYKSQGLIEFTTFHQSYGYEEFIEGIKPVTDSADEEDQTDIKYDIVDGIFKEFCNRVDNSVIKNQENELGLNKNPTVWKVSMWSTGDNPIRTECMENGHIRIGWDDYGPEITSETDFSKFGGRNVLNNFIYKMKVGDIVLSCYSSTTVDAVGIVTGEYEWNGEYEDLNRVRKVNWLVKGINENIVEMNGGTVFTLSSVYKAKVSVADALSIVEKYSPVYANDNVKQQNKVFIIDEINRGNISKIFGELITLVEPSKRVGADEGIKAVLPYSKKPFGIPENIYILGTMNTADRSIATLDTALRRRFDFVEMMPDTKVLEGIEFDGINISAMLEKMNERIAVLFDREHTIGHAYFIGLKDSPDMETLANIFKNKVIPLLQEYFYEDYERIRLVLADNQVSETEEQFIIAETVDSVALFGNSEIDILDDTKRYIINDNAFENADAYIKIYNI